MEVESFSKQVIDELKYYVYGLIDPRNGRYFYIGKGCANRVFEHIKEAQKMRKEGDKLDTLRAILNANLEPICMILRYGLSKEVALEVEATLIDFIGLPYLDNENEGIDSSRSISNAEILRRRLDCPVFEEDKQTPPYMIIKVRDSTASEVGYYEACRSAWKVNPQKANKYKYILCVVNQVVVEVFERTSEWREANKGRYEFDANVAPKEIRGLFIDKKIPQRYRKKGNANPISYSDSSV